MLQHSASTLTDTSMHVVKTIGTMGVPLFLILTGYLMLDRDYSEAYLSKYWKRNLLPLLVAFESWNIIWFILGKFITGRNTFSLWHTVKVAFFAAEADSAFWFLQMLVGIYLGIPVVSVFIHHIQQSHNQHRHNQQSRTVTFPRVLVACVILFGTLIPTAGQVYQLFFNGSPPESVLNMNIFDANIRGASCWILYLLAGFMIRKMNEQGKVPKTAYLALGFGASFCMLIAFNTVFHNHTQTWTVDYPNIFLVASCIFAFMLIERLCDRSELSSSTKVTWIENASKLSFSIYMIHLWIYDAIIPLMKQPLDSNMTFVLLPFAFTLCYFGALGIGWLLSKNRFIRRWLLLMK